jgi:hypothetical protein
MKPIIVPYVGDQFGNHVCFDLMKVLWYRFDAKTEKLNLHFSDGSELNIDYHIDNLKDLNLSFRSLATK